MNSQPHRTEETQGLHPGRGARIGLRIAVLLARTIWTTSVALAAFGLLLLYLNGSFAPFFGESLGVDAVVAVTYSTVGMLVASRRPKNAVGWLFCTIGLSQGIAVFTGEYATYALLTRPDALPVELAAAWLGTWIWVPGVVLNVTFLLLLFPYGRPPSPRWWPVAWLAAGAAVLGSAVIAVWPWDELNAGVSANNPLEIVGVLAFRSEILVLIGVSGTASTLLCVLSLIVRFRRARGEERQQIKWFAYAGGLYVLTILVPHPMVANLQLLTAAFLPIAAGIAILRYRLYDIDLLINRTLVYGSLTVLLASAYVGGVVGLQSVFRVLTGQESTLAVVASTLAIAALFSPLSRRLQGFVDRRFYRRKYDAAKTLASFSSRLREETHLDALSDDVLGVVLETMQPAHASLWLRPHTADAKQDAPG
jgi:hypothetical protein